MLIKCIKNLKSDLPEDLQQKETFNDKEYQLITINKSYVVNAIGLFHGYIYYAIADNAYSYYPRWYPSPLFNVENNKLSKYWVYCKIQYGESENFRTVCSFLEWTDLFFYGKLVEGFEEEVAIFDKYKILMDVEFPDPKVELKASPLENNWAMCPICIDAWQPNTSDGMIICPSCKNVMHNPFYRESTAFTEEL